MATRTFKPPASNPTLPSAPLWRRLTTNVWRLMNMKGEGAIFVDWSGGFPTIRMNTASVVKPTWLQLTGSTSIGTGRWSYSWIEVVAAGGGGFVTKTGGRSSASTGELAYNTMEANASGAGIQPEGIDQANVDAVPGAAFKPIGNGAVVAATREVIASVAEWRFTVPRSPDGSCAGA